MERMTVADDGFYGIFHEAVEPAKPGLAVIVLGGSEGNENVAVGVGARFAERGIPALGICTWNVPGLPSDFVRVPLDPFESAIAWLHGRGYSDVYIYGISEGAKTALLCGSLFPELRGVIALSPMKCLWNGKTGNKHMFGKRLVDAPEYTFQGRGFPYMTLRPRYGKGILNLVLEGQVNIAYLYEESLRDFDESTAIPVEKIQGDILFIYPEVDTMWPSRASAEYMLRRLSDKGFAYRSGALCYRMASHIMVPLEPDALKFFRIERKFPHQCHHSREDAFNRTIGWLLAKPEDRLDEILEL